MEKEIHDMDKVKFSIRYKVSLYVATLLIATVGLICSYILYFGKNIIQEQVELRYITLGKSLAIACKPYILNKNLEKLNEIAKETFKEKEVVTIFFLSGDNNLSLLKLYKKEKEEIAWIGNPVKKNYYGENVEVRRGKDYSQVNLDISPKDNLRLRIIYSHQEINQKIKALAKETSQMFFIFLGLGLIGVIVLTNFIVNPITKITEEVSLVGKGDLSREIKLETNDEIRLLSENFNQMVLNLRKSRQEIEEYNKSLEEKVKERTKELQEAHERIIQNEKMAVLGQFASMVSHELRNPLGAIKLIAYYLKGKLLDNPELIKHADDMCYSVNYAQKIISNILFYSKPTELEFSSININEIIEEILESKAPTFLRNVKVLKKLEEGLPEVRGDKDQIIQGIENFLLNAAQSLSEKGEITISSKVEIRDNKKTVKVDIKDNGCGISKEDLEKIFNPFFTTKAKGIGLGLSVAKNVIEKHKGKILVRSEVDEGSIFSVLLPVNDDLEKIS